MTALGQTDTPGGWRAGKATVGLSQIRESSTFGDLPLTQRLQERVCGVWIVDLRTGKLIGMLRLDDLV